MMPDMGKYAATILLSYGATLVLLAGIVGLTLWRGARVKRALEDVEREQGAGRG